MVYFLNLTSTDYVCVKYSKYNPQNLSPELIYNIFRNKNTLHTKFVGFVSHFAWHVSHFRRCISYHCQTFLAPLWCVTFYGVSPPNDFFRKSFVRQNVTMWRCGATRDCHNSAVCATSMLVPVAISWQVSWRSVSWLKLYCGRWWHRYTFLSYFIIKHGNKIKNKRVYKWHGTKVEGNAGTWQWSEFLYLKPFSCSIRSMWTEQQSNIMCV